MAAYLAVVSALARCGGVAQLESEGEGRRRGRGSQINRDEGEGMSVKGREAYRRERIGKGVGQLTSEIWWAR